MIELSVERIEKILHEETAKKEELSTILRGIYTRYMRLYEKYFADIDALNDEKIAELRKYHEETKSLVKYYLMDIPQDVCTEINEFDKKYSAKLLGPDWHKTLFGTYEEYRDKNKSINKSEESLKAEFREQILEAFYEAMDDVFREGFGTGSKAGENFRGGILSLLFGDQQKQSSGK